MANTPVRIEHADGTVGTYTVASAEKLDEIVQAKVKPYRTKKPKRLFPKWHEGMSSREYVQRYFAYNNLSLTHSREDDYGLLNLSNEPASAASDLVEIEVSE